MGGSKVQRTIPLKPDQWSSVFGKLGSLNKETQEAFQATLRDPAFRAEAKKLGFDISPLSGEEMVGLIAGLYASPADVIEATRAALRGDRK